MILKALCDYYDRSAAAMPPMYYAFVRFQYAILIDAEGNFKGLERLGGDADGLSLLTFRPEERTSSPVAHVMGDNGSYILGLKDIHPDKPLDFEAELKKNAKNHNSFVQLVNDLHKALPTNLYACAVYSFYNKYGPNTVKQMSQDPEWPSMCKLLGKNITFLIVGAKRKAAEDQEIINYCIEHQPHSKKKAICLISGKLEPAVSTTYSTFVNGGKSNAKLVAFQINSGYDSYGKQKGFNAPISEEAEFKYTTALVSMLKKGSRYKFQVGLRTYLFWASRNTEAGQKAEESFFSLFGFSGQEDDPDKGIEQVRKVFEAIYSGSLKTSSDDIFYILGLAPNSARIAVTYWAEIPLRKFAETICRHFDDLKVADARPEKKPYTSLYHLVRAVTVGGKVADATPNLTDSLVKSIFEGLPFPQTLFASCIRRIRAETGDKDKNAVNITRAAIIKAYLNRLNNTDKIKVMLDKENSNQGYLCGRLFAVLDKIQEEANKQHSIRERYMNSASSTPATVFSTILNLSNHHIENLQSEGRKIFFEKLKQEIFSKIDADGFKAQLDLQDQGRFFIGYYHQRQDFFLKSDENKEEQ